MQENRLARVEAQLSGRQKVLAWMHRQQQLGGYMQMVTRSAETNGASGATIELLDLEAAFVFYLALDCNMDVLKLQAAHSERALVCLCLNRFEEAGERPPQRWELEAFRRLMKVFVLNWKLLEQSTAVISNEYFDGMQVLWDDAKTALIKELAFAESLCGEFNLHVASRYAVDPITGEELQEYVSEALPQKVKFAVKLARGQAEFEFGNRYSAYTHIAEGICLTEVTDLEREPTTT